MIKPVYESNIEDFSELLSFINTLEVKEVDLEKEIDFYIESTLTGTNPIYTKGGVSCIIDKSAKHFFELGMAVSNGGINYGRETNESKRIKRT